MLDPELKAKWVSALESGEFTQGRTKLFDPESKTHCCLGVLCEVANIPIDETTNNYNATFVPLGLTPGVIKVLWKKNDGAFGDRRETFPEIAQYIKETL